MFVRHILFETFLYSEKHVCSSICIEESDGLIWIKRNFMCQF